ncbi:acetoin utilization AcuB family protein [Heyndrickxia acidicola]|uniref:Acetoin utilization AcuB family protein n=1 Tax=Heyndrickxia acidicola TaxID=209389 RepID=A0ABU6MET1_9BACI|nr:acetoin utilization AcuB family protein [Heyndrickxia acidicola]MED1203172.1 acetoin utilization AcuB family protein [Heyndrickxia acidicola]
MIVEEIMTRDVAALKPDDTVQAALALMKEKTIRHIPLINELDELAGLVTERDIKGVLSNSLLNSPENPSVELPLRKLMKTNILTGHPLDFVEEVAVLFYENKIGCLPILENQKLVGIITGTDLLHTMVKITGADQPGSQIELKVPNRSGILHEITGIIQKHRVNVHSLLVYPDKSDPHSKILVFRVNTMNPLTLIQHLKDEGYTVLWPNMPGISE